MSFRGSRGGYRGRGSSSGGFSSSRGGSSGFSSSRGRGFSRGYRSRGGAPMSRGGRRGSSSFRDRSDRPPYNDYTNGHSFSSGRDSYPSREMRDREYPSMRESRDFAMAPVSKRYDSERGYGMSALEYRSAGGRDYPAPRDYASGRDYAPSRDYAPAPLARDYATLARGDYVPLDIDYGPPVRDYGDDYPAPPRRYDALSRRDYDSFPPSKSYEGMRAGYGNGYSSPPSRDYAGSASRGSFRSWAAAPYSRRERAPRDTRDGPPPRRPSASGRDFGPPSKRPRDGSPSRASGGYSDGARGRPTGFKSRGGGGPPPHRR